MANKEALRSIRWIIRRMHREGSKGKAPVLMAEDFTKDDPFRMLLFTMLSARTKDETTIRILRSLLEIARTPEEICALGAAKLERKLYGIGFYRVKTRHLIALCKALIGKDVPDDLEGLMALPGVGRKTANIVLARAFGHPTIGVDVHVHRVSNRLGIVNTKKPEDTEAALIRSIPQNLRRDLNRDFVAFGQTICKPRNPLCSICPLNRLCWRRNVSARCDACAHGK